MQVLNRILAVVVLLLMAAPLVANEPEPEAPAPEGESEPQKEGEAEEKPQSMSERIRESLKDVAEVTGKTEINEEQLKQIIALKSQLDEAMKDVTEFQAASNRNVKEAFDVLIKSVEYQAWAKKNELEAEPFARRMFRLQSIYVREYLPGALDEAIKYQRRMLEEFKGMLPEDEYKQALERFEEDKAEVARAREELSKIPAPTDAEKKLLAKYNAELADMMGMPVQEEPAKAPDSEADE
jgi:hypothetical protein